MSTVLDSTVSCNDSGIILGPGKEPSDEVTFFGVTFQCEQRRKNLIS
jgi:hypothetical protein